MSREAKAVLPRKLDELTPEWLTRALRASGVIEDASVSQVEAEVLGEGQGFTGTTVRLRLRFDRPESGAPDSVIVKLPTTSRLMRAQAELLGVYEREVLFYRELADEAPIRKPRCYLAAMDPRPFGSPERDAERLRAMERLPAWVLKLLAFLAVWLMRLFSRRRYVLLLEDLAPARLGDQIAGCRPEETTAILRALARLHAAFWNSPRIESLPWITSLNEAPRLMRIGVLQARSEFEARYAGRLAPDVWTLLSWLDEHVIELGERACAGPFTLLHGDFRLDNMFIDDADGKADIALFDWQIPIRGPGVYDVAYFLSGTLETDVDPATERELVHTYHAELVAHGVFGYDFDACLRDYRRCLVWMLHRVSMAPGGLEFTNQRGLDLIDVWVERLAARLRDEKLDGLLD